MDGEKKIRFRNDGGPYRHLDGSIKLPGRVFKAFPSEISESMRTHIKPVDEEEDPTTAPLPEPKIESGYNVESKGGAYYNVVQKATGKVMNEKGLKKEDAETLVKSLEE